MKVQLPLTRMSHLVSAIYDSAVDPALWPIALDGIRHEMRFATAVLNTAAMPNGQIILSIAAGITPYWLARISDFDSEIVDLWGGPDIASEFPLGEPVKLSEINPDAFAPPINRYIAEWGYPQGLIDTMAIIVARDGASLGAVAFGRHRDDGEIGEEELSLGRLLAPHLQRAATISRLLKICEIATCFATLVDKLTLPVMFVTSDLCVVHLNSAAEAVLRQGHGLQLQQGRIGSSDSAFIHSLMNAVQKCASEEIGFVKSASGIPLRHSKNELAIAHVLPLPREGVRSTPTSAAVAAVIIAQPPSWNAGAHDAVAALYELTPAETRVFKLISRGSSLHSTAEALGVASSTAKTHLLRIFDKLGVHRQADLVRIASALSSPVN